MLKLPAQPFCLIRHGQTDANRDGIIAGRLEAALTDDGRNAARALAARQWVGPITIFSSPQIRAQETAALAFPGRDVQIVEGLRERHWGIYEGRPVAELPPRTGRPDGGEAWEDMVSRISAALAECITQADGTLPVIVGHSGVIRAVRALVGLDFAGPSAPNTQPLLYCPSNDATTTRNDIRWTERALTSVDQA